MSPPAIVDPTADWLNEAVEVVRAGGVVALPFERLFGLAADVTNPRAVERVARLKGRERPGADRPIAVVLPALAAADGLVTELSPLAIRLAERHWPGPLTMLLPAVAGLPPQLISDRGLIGLRLSSDCPAAELARAVGHPLTATSANPVGAPDARDHHQVAAALPAVDLVLAGTVPGPPGSTVVDASGARPVVVRSGVIDVADGETDG